MGTPGGPPPLDQEFVIRGPFKDADYSVDAYVNQDPTSPTDARNYDTSFGVLAPRPGKHFLTKFVETIDNGGVSVFNAHAFIGSGGGGANLGLSFVEVLDSCNIYYKLGAADTVNVGQAAGVGRASDIIAIGRWYQMDALMQSTFNNPPPIQAAGNSYAPATWSKQRYKVVTFGGTLNFTNGSALATTGAIAPFNMLNAWLIGGYIRACTNAGEAYGNIYRIYDMDNTGSTISGSNVLGGRLSITPNYAGPTQANSRYAIYLPISDSSARTVSPPLYVPPIDYCEMPNSQGTFYAQIDSDVNAVTALGTFAEFSRAYTIVPADSVPAVGMSYRKSDENITETRAIVRSEPTGVPSEYELWLWPPYANASGIVPCEILARTQLWVTGSFGSTIVSPGVTPMIGQARTDTTWYLANSAVPFADRMILATDMSYERPDPTVLTQYADLQPIYHPGRIVTSGNGFYTEFTGREDIDQAQYDLPIGPVMHLFVMRDTMYAVSATGIMSAQRTGQAQNPLRFATVITGEQFIPWSKPMVIQGSQAIILTENAVNIFDGGGLRPISQKIDNLYQQWVSTNIIDGHPRCHYDETAGRVILTKGTIDASSEPFGNTILVGDIESGEWKTYEIPNGVTGGAAGMGSNIGGAASWENPALPTTFGKRYQRDTEFIVHSISRAIASATATTWDEIACLRRTLNYDQDYAGTLTNVAWSWLSPYMDLGNPRNLKSVTGVRIVFEVGMLTANLMTVAVSATQKGQVVRTVSGTVDLAGGAAGVVGSVQEVWFRTPPVANDPTDSGNGMPLTGFTFNIKLSQTAASVADTFRRPVIREIALIYRDRAELRTN